MIQVAISLLLLLATATNTGASVTQGGNPSTQRDSSDCESSIPNELDGLKELDDPNSMFVLGSPDELRGLTRLRVGVVRFDFNADEAVPVGPHQMPRPSKLESDSTELAKLLIARLPGLKIDDSSGTTACHLWVMETTIGKNLTPVRLETMAWVSCSSTSGNLQFRRLATFGPYDGSANSNLATVARDFCDMYLKVNSK